MRSLLLDTNIVQYLAHNKIRRCVDDALLEIDTDLHLLSEYSLFELFRNAKKEHTQKIVPIIEHMTLVQVAESVLVTAAVLGTKYRAIHGSNVSHINDGDLIIAATALQKNATIVTANGIDFPNPFFVEVQREHVEYEHRNRTKCLVLHFLAPDWEVVQRYFS